MARDPPAADGDTSLEPGVTAGQLRSVFSRAAVGVAIVDLDGRFIEANDVACTMLGYPLDELRRLTFAEVTHPDDVARTAAEVKRLLSGDADSFAMEKRYLRQDGGVTWSSTSVTLVRNSGGDAEQFIGILHPIEDRRAAAEVASRLAAVVNSSDDAIITKTLDGLISTWNSAAERMFGYTADEAIGQPVTMLMPADQQDEEPDILRRLRRGDRVHHYETTRVRKDGSLVHVSLSVSPLKDAGGRIIGASKIARDISRRRRDEAALREHSHVLELLSATGSVIASDLDLRSILQRVTDLGTEISGAQFGAFFYNVPGEESQSFQLFTLSGAPREAFDRLDLPRTTGVFDPTFGGIGIVRSDDISVDPRYGQMVPSFGMSAGHLPVRSYLAVPVIARSGQVLGGLMFAHSSPGVFAGRAERLIAGVAAQAAVAVDNARLYEDAQREIANREAVEAQLREADRRKDEFLATLAHELRNPLAPIRQSAALAGAPGSSEQQRRSAIGIISRQVQHMAALLDDLLDVARTTRGTFDLSPRTTTIGEVVDVAVEIARPLIEVRGHSLQLGTPQADTPIFGDPLRLAQVLGNLLTNAAKYTDPAGTIQLSAVAKQGEVQFSVRDTGIGIDAESLPQLFGMFAQVESARARSGGGLGIGLALAKSLTELHGGRIEARSEGLGRGSEFIVSIPVVKPEPVPVAADPVAPAAPVDPPAAGARRVLIADDNEDAALTLALLLEISGHQVAVAHDGAQALQKFDEVRPEVVVLDIGMPGMDGYEVARRLRSRPDADAVTLIALTGWGQHTDKANALAAGFDLHFTKPVDPDRILDLLEGRQRLPRS
ncbi:MAG: PAS domain S-box protein [Steroidobacteraceae bacterium]